MNKDFENSTTGGIQTILLLLLALLVIAILCTAVLLSQQTQTRHDTFKRLHRLQQDMQDMKQGEGRLIIEQQTFSAIPNVVIDAHQILGMVYPDAQNRLVLPSPD